MDDNGIDQIVNFIKYCKVIKRGDLTKDPRFRTNPLRTKNKKKLIPILDTEMAKKTRQEWSTIFDTADLPYSPINNMKEICEDPHIKYREMLVDIDQPRAGRMKIAGSPIHLSETPGKVYAPAPLLGEHSEEVLKNILGYSQEEIDELKKERIINREV